MHESRGNGEASIFDAVSELDKPTVHRRVLENAQDSELVVTDDHLDVIDTLIEHYKATCETDDCLEAHRHMRFLEKAYAERGGSRYLYKLFDDGKSNGVLHIIHNLVGLPELRLDVDEGFGTAF